MRIVRRSQGTQCAMISVTTTNASGTEGTARSTGNSLGGIALPVSPAGISSRMDVVIRSATTPHASLTALSAGRLSRAPASTWPFYISCHKCFEATSPNICPWPVLLVLRTQVWHLLRRPLPWWHLWQELLHRGLWLGRAGLFHWHSTQISSWRADHRGPAATQGTAWRPKWFLACPGSPVAHQPAREARYKQSANGVSIFQGTGGAGTIHTED